ncbi:PREDICTED: uncharacterized protein LOC105570709 [Vollenhovia emeryi]|uniref:uncharacterized protein LOC105570709 n=1 Tax=Vollenhovia emeryi TaxID=411798 RepID=UPI0005F43C73|nr:PREDICTED: uncharacterized protein LOC105570709 [Vollenhovia emeryi]
MGAFPLSASWPWTYNIWTAHSPYYTQRRASLARPIARPRLEPIGARSRRRRVSSWWFSRASLACSSHSWKSARIVYDRGVNRGSACDQAAQHTNILFRSRWSFDPDKNLLTRRGKAVIRTSKPTGYCTSSPKQRQKTSLV